MFYHLNAICSASITERPHGHGLTISNMILFTYRVHPNGMEVMVLSSLPPKISHTYKNMFFMFDSLLEEGKSFHITVSWQKHVLEYFGQINFCNYQLLNLVYTLKCHVKIIESLFRI